MGKHVVLLVMFLTPFAALGAQAEQKIVDLDDFAILGDRQWDLSALSFRNAIVGYKWIAEVTLTAEAVVQIRVEELHWLDWPQAPGELVCAHLLLNGLIVDSIERSECGGSWTSRALTLQPGSYDVILEAPRLPAAQLAGLAGTLSQPAEDAPERGFANVSMREIRLLASAGNPSRSGGPEIDEVPVGDLREQRLSEGWMHLGDDPLPAAEQPQSGSIPSMPRWQLQIEAPAAGRGQIRIDRLRVLMNQFPPAQSGRVLLDGREVGVLRGRDRNGSTQTPLFDLAAGSHTLIVEPVTVEGKPLDLLLSGVYLLSPAAPRIEVAPKPGTQPAPARVQPLTDPLDTAGGRWRVDATAFFDGGAYHIKARTYVTAHQFEDGYVSLSTRHVAGPLNGGYGLVFRANDDDGDGVTAGYILLASSDGSWKLKRFVGQKDEPIRDWTNSEHLRTGANAVNVIGVACSGPRMRVFINDVCVGEAEDATHRRGSIGPIVSYQDLEVAFSMLEVSEGDPEERAGPEYVDGVLTDPLDGRYRHWTTTRARQFRDGAFHFEEQGYEANYGLGEGSASLEMQYLGGDRGVGHGLAFRVRSEAGVNVGYVALINNVGAWIVGEITGERVKPLTAWVRAEGMRTSVGAWNTLRVQCTGAEIEVFLNDRSLGKVGNLRHLRGGVGPAVAGDGAHVAFRNLKVTPSTLLDDFDWLWFF